MAPRPLSTTIRTNRHIRKPSSSSSSPAPPEPVIYAIASGPMRGVHMLSPTPPPPELQYLYRHPITHHPTFLHISGDFLRRRFTSIEAAIAWIDDQQRQDELVKGLEGVGLGKGKEPASEGSRVGKGEMIVERLPRRDAGGQRKRRVEPVYGVQKRADGGSKGVKYSMSHVGVRRRELMYNMVSGEEGDRVKGGWDAGKGAVEAEVEECHGVEFGGKGEAGKEGKVGFGHPDAMEVEEEL